ncbi:MAG: right-handed parallel beta-helix repeat-containing protein [bacterium]|nr:MAG: right-handed parallel beta-helix repeat-containing protein [bacterium]
MSRHLQALYFFLISFFALLCIYSPAGIIRVPQDQAGIQAGINAATNGDTVLVADSTYYENINFMGKTITVASLFLMDGDTNHINNTIINGNQPSHTDSGSVVSFVSGEDTTSMICGFTITGGTGTVSADSRVGGGIFCYSSGARIVHNKIVSNLITAQNARGGGIGAFPFGNNNYSIIEDNIISMNTCTGIQRGQGGGIYMPQGKIYHNIIRENLCQAGQNGYALGGGIHGACDLNVQRHLYITNNLIANNQCTNSDFSSRGGGIDIWRVVVYAINNTITHNQVSGLYTYGGGIDLFFAVSPSIIRDNFISFNSSTGSTDSQGGGMYYYQTTGITIMDNYIEGNGSFLGGGISSESGIGNYIYRNDFFNNESRSGGGIYFYDSEDTLYANRIHGNRASQYHGGGIYIYDCSPRILNNIITGNKSGLNGGGIYISGNSNAAQLVNNTIVADTAGLNGGGICSNMGSPLVMNTILWGNSAPNGGQIYTGVTNTEVIYCDVQGGWPGIGNIFKEPMLRGEFFSLSDSSSCIGAGTLSYQFGPTTVQCPSTCFLGHGRPSPSGTNPDMGACESPLFAPLVGLDSQMPENLPLSYNLKQNYPNPFNPTTVISWQLAVGSPVKLTVFDLSGQRVAILVDEHLLAGNHSVLFDVAELASGVYFYQLEASNFKQTRKMLLVR